MSEKNQETFAARKVRQAAWINLNELHGILEAFEYSEEQKALVYKRDLPPRGKAGQIAGSEYKPGMRQVMFNKTRYLAKDIIYAITHRKWPAGRVRFRDGDQTNTHPDNLYVDEKS